MDDWGMWTTPDQLANLVVVGVWGAVSWYLCLGVGYVVDKIKAAKKKTEIRRSLKNLPNSEDRVGEVSVSFYSKRPKGIKSSAEKKSMDKKKKD